MCCSSPRRTADNYAGERVEVLADVDLGGVGLGVGDVVEVLEVLEVREVGDAVEVLEVLKVGDVVEVGTLLGFASPPAPPVWTPSVESRATRFGLKTHTRYRVKRNAVPNASPTTLDAMLSASRDV